MDMKELLDGVFNEGTEEYELIVDTYNLIVQSAPTIASEAKTHLLLLDHNKIKLATLYYSLNRRIMELQDSVQQTHDASYMRLVKLGRPSKEAIESEIRATNPEYAGVSRQINMYESVRDLISNYMRCIDSSRMTTTEILRNIYRVD